MGKSASLYEVNSENFDSLKIDSFSFENQMASDFELFDKNFEGLIFILKKCLPDQSRLLEELFYGTSYLGELTNDPDSVKKIVPYHSQKKVKEFNDLLNSIEKDTFLSNYDSTELNQNEIYPNMWHDDESVDYGFNQIDLGNVFDALCRIFHQAATNNNYILCFIG